MLKTLQKVQKYIYNHHLIKSEGQIIVGVSGGADSVMLLHLLLSIGYDCVIAHCNFHLRADESERDEIFVQSLAQKLKIPYYHIDFNTKEIAKEKHISIEMAARDLRYNWFKDLLIELNGQAIAVAHHADDNIETLLMNLVRGTGLRGLTGMSPRNGNVIRPLLCCNRLEIEKYLLENQLEYVTDSSNLSNDYKRNKFRNVILPLLEEINPSVRQTLCESIERFEGTLAIYEQAISNFNDELIEINSNNVRINICLLNKQINKKIILYELLKPYGFSSAVVEQIVSHLDSESGKLFYSVTHRLVKDRDFLIISIIESKKK
jgi:tRNA(Ile)-lysidine synthase